MNRMSGVIGDWTGFHAHKNGVTWQEGYFDHRLRADEHGEQLSAKMDYIRQNPVAAGCVERPKIRRGSSIHSYKWIDFSEGDANPRRRRTSKSGGKPPPWPTRRDSRVPPVAINPCAIRIAQLP